MKRVMTCTPAVLLIALGLSLVSMAQAPQSKSKAKDREIKTLEQHLGVTYSDERLAS